MKLKGLIRMPIPGQYVLFGISKYYNLCKYYVNVFLTPFLWTITFCPVTIMQVYLSYDERTHYATNTARDLHNWEREAFPRRPEGLAAYPQHQHPAGARR